MIAGTTFSIPASRSIRARGERIDSAAAFTLVEILVVVAIIATLVAILVPSLGQMQRAGNRSHIRGQLSSLQTALQQYYADFNSYPPSAPTMFAGNVTVNRGSAMLAQGLMGYLDYAQDGAGPTGNPLNPNESRMGFRTRSGGMGRVYGPYAPNSPSTYKANSANDQVFVDMFGGEILYYRCTRAGTTGAPTPQTLFGVPATSYFTTTDNPMANGAPLTSPLAGTKKFFLNIWQGGANVYTDGPVVGSDSYLLISRAEDNVTAAQSANKQYFNDVAIVAGKQ